MQSQSNVLPEDPRGHRRRRAAALTSARLRRGARTYACLGAVSGLFNAPMLQAAAKDEPLYFRGNLAWLNLIEHVDLERSSPLNPNNESIQAPHDRAVSELRPNLKLTTNNLQLIARPRIRYSYDLIKVGDKERAGASNTSTVLNEAFGQWTISPRVTFAYGLQSFQWGAAESLSPSNRIFHDTAAQRDVLYEVRGKNLARLNFSVGKAFSTVLLAEVKENTEEAAFVADEPWQAKALVKSEYSWNNGADYLGLVAGAYQHGHPWVGEYLSYGIPGLDGLTAFADVSHQWGGEAWYPVIQQAPSPSGLVPQTVFEQSLQSSHKTLTLAAVGAKFDFINGVILRGEYIYNEAGYSRRQFQQAVAAVGARTPVQSSVLATNLKRFLSPGLDLPGQRYAYGSVHVPDFLHITDLMADARTFYSLTDHSTLSYAALDYKVGGSGTLSLATAAATGARDSELKGYASAIEYLAYRHDW